VACLWGYAAAGEEDSGWLVAEGLDDESPFYQYTVALYFAVMTITTVGYGDVTPTNRNEYLLVTVIMIAGGFLWAYVIGGICNVVSNMDVDKRQFQQDFDRVNNMLMDLGLPQQFCLYVRRYMFKAEDMLRRNTYNDLIGMLTPEQQKEIAVHRSRANLVQIPYFRDCSAGCVLKVYSALRQMVFAPQEFLDAPYTLYIIVNSGVVAKGGVVFTRGSCLAADFILESEELLDPSYGTALTFVQVECLHRDTLMDVLESFPRDKAIVRRAKIRLSFMRKVVVMSKQYKREQKELRDKALRGRLGNISRSSSIPEVPAGDPEGQISQSASLSEITAGNPLPPVTFPSNHNPTFVAKLSSVRQKADYHQHAAHRKAELKRKSSSSVADSHDAKEIQTTVSQELRVGAESIRPPPIEIG
jgi:hypothetical protein